MKGRKEVRDLHAKSGGEVLGSHRKNRKPREKPHLHVRATDKVLAVKGVLAVKKTKVLADKT
jgi:hypothetical protein